MLCVFLTGQREKGREEWARLRPNRPQTVLAPRPAVRPSVGRSVVSGACSRQKLRAGRVHRSCPTLPRSRPLGLSGALMQAPALARGCDTAEPGASRQGSDKSEEAAPRRALTYKPRAIWSKSGVPAKIAEQRRLTVSNRSSQKAAVLEALRLSSFLTREKSCGQCTPRFAGRARRQAAQLRAPVLQKLSVTTFERNRVLRVVALFEIVAQHPKQARRPRQCWR